MGCTILGRHLGAVSCPPWHALLIKVLCNILARRNRVCCCHMARATLAAVWSYRWTPEVLQPSPGTRKREGHHSSPYLTRQPHMLWNVSCTEPCQTLREDNCGRTRPVRPPDC